MIGLVAVVGVCAAQRDDDWPMPARDHANTRYASLAEIDTANVGRLRLASTFPTGVARGHEAAPIVVGDTMYIVTPYPNVVYALDLSTAGLHVRWKFEPKPDPFSQGVACCDVVNLGLAVADGKVFVNTLDNQTLALDASSGKELWRFRSADPRTGETRTMAPLVARGRVLIGNDGVAFGVRGWLAALDENTGKEVWRAYSTGPDRDVLIGPDYRAFYPKDRGTDLGVATWPQDAWRIGGGTVSGWLSFDPDLGLVYYGTANPAPSNPEQRPGDNKFTSGIFARDIVTGSARWFYQLSPHDQFRYDAGNENIVVDLALPGGPRKTLLHADRNGYVYVFDRLTGEVLSATPFVRITTSSGVDSRTGELHYAPARQLRANIVTRDICPSSAGAKNWQPSAWSPRTRLLYLPHQNLCQDEEVMATSFIAGTPYLGAIVKMKRGAEPRGRVTAWDPVARRAAWTLDEEFPVWSGALATAGDLLFYGTMDGWFKAVDARSGKLLWRFNTGSGIVGQPIAYRGPGGKEYIAVLSGVGGWAGAVAFDDIDTRDGSAAGGFANAMRDLRHPAAQKGMLHVFALP